VPGRHERELGAAVLAAHPGVGDGAAELLGDELGAVADAEDRDAEVVDGGVDATGALDVDRLGAAGEDDAGGLRAATSAAVMVWGTISL
jgi:hypothetical protein